MFTDDEFVGLVDTDTIFTTLVTQEALFKVRHMIKLSCCHAVMLLLLILVVTQKYSIIDRSELQC